MKVPFVDLRAMHEEVRPEFTAAFNDILDHSSFIGGPYVANFEKHFAAYQGAKSAVACASGTDAVKYALKASGIRPGDGVITSPNTFIATVEAITALGAVPIFVDIDISTYHLSAKHLRDYLEHDCQLGSDSYWVDKRTGTRITTLLPVHLFGMIAEMQPLVAIAKEFNLTIVEDAAQAHGATYQMNGTVLKAGVFGAAAGFSFYPAKNLGALGEGGAVVTNDPDADQRIRMWRDHGSSKKYVHVSPDGWNSRLDTLQCAFLDIKLRQLDRWNAGRRQAAAWYQQGLADDARIVLPQVPEGREHVYHLFVVRVPDRDRVKKVLGERGIGCGLHYPIPLHLQDAYKDLGYAKGDFPEAETAAETILSLPMFPHLTEEMVAYVCENLKDVL